MKEFNTKALAEFDEERVAAALDAAIQRAILDCEDRPALKTKRTVTLELHFVPMIVGAEREIDAVDMTWSIGAKAPKQERSGVVMPVYRGGKIGYNPHSLESPDQRTIFDDEETQAEESDD